MKFTVKFDLRKELKKTLNLSSKKARRAKQRQGKKLLVNTKKAVM